MIQKCFILCIICFLFATLFSCTRQAPVIYDYFWQITLVNDTETKKVYEKLSFFVNANDEDGDDDIEKIYLLHDSRELFWEIDPRTWHKSSVNGELWTGTNGITMHDLSDIPQGEYRIVVQDISGEFDEETFLLKRPDIKKSTITFPTPEVKENRLYVKGRSPVYSLWIYDRKWNHVPPTYEVEETGFDCIRIMSRKKELNQGFYYYLYLFDSSLKRGFLTGPYFFSRE